MNDTRPRVLIASVQVPFSRGGAEILVDGLRRELVARGFLADVLALPFNAVPKNALLDQAALWRSIDVRSFNGKPVDLVIGTKFPSYLLDHPNKVVWMVHQHRQMYDLYGSPFGDFKTSTEDESLRRLLTMADRRALTECKKIYTISGNVAERLDRFLGLPASPLLPPLPLAGRYRNEQPERYILSVGRLCTIKRVDLLIKALPQIADRLSLKIVGQPDEPGIERYLQSEIEKHHLAHRVEFLGRVDDERLIELYARAFAVYYAPYDEDYGFVTLEGLASGKPIITASDSGGVLEFVTHEGNGLIADPNEQAIAQAINRLNNDRELYGRLSQAALGSELPSTWDTVIESLTESIRHSTEETTIVSPPSETIETESELEALPIIPVVTPAGNTEKKASVDVFFRRE